LAAQSEFVAAELQRRGVRVGDRVVVCLPNSTEAITSLYGVWLAGACVVMTEADSTFDSLAYRVAHCGATAIIVSAARRADARAVADGVAGAPTVVVVDDLARPLDQPPAPSHIAPPIDPDEPALILYTSGSVGPPKGVTHSQRSISAVVSSVAEYLQHTPDDVVLCVLELAFGYGLLQALVTFETGGRLVLRRGFGLPFDVVSVIESERVTGLAGVPTLFALLCELRDLSALDTSSLRYLTNAGAALPPPLGADRVLPHHLSAAGGGRDPTAVGRTGHARCRAVVGGRAGQRAAERQPR
jgi:acyl-CoA synthetase (AMP-forming)/AMP-acid ligase II